MNAMSKAAREDILAKIKSALKREGQLDSPRNPDVPGLNAPDESEPVTGRNQHHLKELVKQFELELLLVGGHFYIASTVDSACNYIEALASKRRARSVIS